MPELEKLGRVLSSDILIVGGGISGLTAAITAKETDSSMDVLVVDKAVASKGYAGMAGRTAGLLSFVTPEDDPEEFVRYNLSEIGCFLNDQILLREFAHSSRRIVAQLASWGVEVLRDQKGNIEYAKWPFPWGTASIDPDMCMKLAAHAKKLGVRFLDRTSVVDIVKEGEQVVGAVGFDVTDGELYTFTTGTIVLANGSQNYDITLLWCGTGNGLGTAWRAGAEMRNAEFGCMCDFARVDPQGWLYYGVHGGAHIAHDHLLNAKGENVSAKYRPGLHSSMDPVAANAWLQEFRAGNAPISVDASIFSQPAFFKFHPKALDQMHREAAKANFPMGRPYQVVPGFIGELSCVKVNHEMATTIPGLFAIGNVAGSGSARGGAVPTPPAKIHGTGILNALFMGTKGGPAAALHASAVRGFAADRPIRPEQINFLRNRIMSPLQRKDGIDPHDLIHQIQDVVSPVDYSVVKSEKGMSQALKELTTLKPLVEQLSAKDPHGLCRCIDAESMVLSAELFFRSSLARKESRGFHFREDYPRTDNSEWLRWVIVRSVSGNMEIATERIPIETYPYQVH
ncbi:MAG TPA: FAD-binding protein [Candidatus Nanoarchaeia archaeon]|nr:FAD-binding protein [Candidatus Nanoarchaeia archaeon]